MSQSTATPAFAIRIKSFRNYHMPLRVIAVLLAVILILLAFRTPASTNAPTIVSAASHDHSNCHSDLEIERAGRDYQIELGDNFVVIYDGQRVVGTLTYRTSLGRMMMADNE
jgi:hypothetical protein